MRYLFVMLLIVLIAPLIMRGCLDDEGKKVEVTGSQVQSVQNTQYQPMGVRKKFI